MIDVNKSLIENIDYLRRLALELDNKEIDKIDSNLLYEVAYADTYLDVLISKSNSESLNKDLLDIKYVFDGVLSQAPYGKLDSIKSNYVYKKLLSCRYDSLDDASYERSYTTADKSNAILFYLSSQAQSIVTVVFVVVFIFFLSSNKGSFFGTEGLPYEFSLVCNIVLFLMVLVSTLLVSTLFLKLALDLMYITTPIGKIISDRFISKDAISAVQECLDDTVILSSQKDYSRIERNKYWLDSMLEVLKYSEDTDTEDLYKEALNLKQYLEDLESRGIKNESYYLGVAKIEFLHDKYLELVK